MAQYQYAYPTSQITNQSGSWILTSTGATTNLYQYVDETGTVSYGTSGSDSITDSSGGDLYLELKFGSLTNPIIDSRHHVDINFIGIDASTLTFKLYQGATLIDTQTYSVRSAEAGGDINRIILFSKTAVAGVTDYTDLRVRVSCDMSGTEIGRMRIGVPSTGFQRVYPVADITTTNWNTGGANYYGQINSEIDPANDITGVNTSTTSATLEVKFGTLTDPLSSVDHYVNLYLQNQATGSFSLYLYQGATLIATLASGVQFNGTANTRTPSFALTGTQIDNITDYSDLRLRVVNGLGSSQYVYAAEMEVPAIPKILTPVSRSYSLTGTSVNLKVARKFTANVTAFTETGRSSFVNRGRLFSLTQGSFAETGNATYLNFGHKLAPTVAGFTETGINAGVFKGFKASVSAGNFSLSGSLVLRKTNILSAVKSTYSFTGSSAILTYIPISDFIAQLNPGSFTQTTSSINLSITRKISPAVNNIALTGTNTYVNKNRFVQLSTGSFALAGINTYLRFGKTVQLQQGNLTLAGNSTTVKVGRSISPSTRNLNISATSLILTKVYTVTAQRGIFTQTRYPAAFTHNLPVIANPNAIFLTGRSVNMKYGRIFPLLTNLINVNGTNTEIFAARDGLIFARLITIRSPRFAAMDD